MNVKDVIVNKLKSNEWMPYGYWPKEYQDVLSDLSPEWLEIRMGCGWKPMRSLTCEENSIYRIKESYSIPYGGLYVPANCDLLNVNQCRIGKSCAIGDYINKRVTKAGMGCEDVRCSKCIADIDNVVYLKQYVADRGGQRGILGNGGQDISIRNKSSIASYMGKVKRGEVTCKQAADVIHSQVPSKRMSDENKKIMLQMRDKGFTQGTISRAFDVSLSTVSRIMADYAN